MFWTSLLYFLASLGTHYFRDIQKKGPKPKLFVWKHESDKKYLSVGNFGILSVVVIICFCGQIIQKNTVFHLFNQTFTDVYKK